ncbi:MAG: hypothetical protein ABSH53_18305 [Holophaga sp.]|jgi:hypothetical protein
MKVQFLGVGLQGEAALFDLLESGVEERARSVFNWAVELRWRD